MRTVLAPPVAIARWIASRQPELAGKKQLRILVVGAQQYDAFDRGRWYGLLPALLGTDLQVSTTLIGPKLSTSMTTLTAKFLPKEFPRATTQQSTLGEYLKSHSVNEFDIACIFHPGFEHYHEAWFKDDSLAELILTNIPLIATSYGEGEFQRDRYMLDIYGYKIFGEPMLNPFHQNFKKAIQGILDVKWGYVIWQFENRVPGPEHVVEEERIKGVVVLSQAIVQSAALGISHSTSHCGIRKLLPESEDNRDFFIPIFNDFLLRERTRQVYALLHGGLKIVNNVSLTEKDWKNYPGENAQEVERAIWGAKIVTCWAEVQKK